MQHSGIVKFFDNKKGWGFLNTQDLLDPQDGKPTDVFVHFSNIQETGYRTLKDGELVNFETIETSKGLQAVNVTKVPQ